jgi:hypothetical protein
MSSVQNAMLETFLRRLLVIMYVHARNTANAHKMGIEKSHICWQTMGHQYMVDLGMMKQRYQTISRAAELQGSQLSQVGERRPEVNSFLDILWL